MKLVILPMLAVLALPGIALSQSPPQQTLWPQATPVRMRINRTVSSADAQVGDIVPLEILDDVQVGELIVIAKGSTALAEVTEAVPKRRMARGGKLAMNVGAVLFSSGKGMPLRGETSISGVGKDITIVKGHQITVYVNSDYDLDKVILAQFPTEFLVTASNAYAEGTNVRRITRLTDKGNYYVVDCLESLFSGCYVLTAGEKARGYVQSGWLVLQIGGKAKTYGKVVNSVYSPSAENTPDQSPSAKKATPDQPGKADAPASGTGFAVAPEGYILTNAHVVAGCAKVTARIGDVEHSVTIVSTDAQNDLALLKVPVALGNVLPLRDGPRVQLGEAVLALGYPLQGLISASLNVTSGNISSLSGLGDDARMLQFTAPIQPGNSGSPLLDASGNVVGIVTSKLSPLWAAANIGDLPQNVNFAVKASVIREFLESRDISFRGGRLDQPVPFTVLSGTAGTAIVALKCFAEEVR
jgi:S1-C subfamily serine protease